MATLGIPTPLVYWKRPWARAHIYVECPDFVKEWAGWNFQQYRTAKTQRQAARHTTGLCPRCWFVYQFQVRQGRPELSAALSTQQAEEVAVGTD